jgi:hypothetical protein
MEYWVIGLIVLVVIIMIAYYAYSSSASGGSTPSVSVSTLGGTTPLPVKSTSSISESTLGGVTPAFTSTTSSSTSMPVSTPAPTYSYPIYSGASAVSTPQYPQCAGTTVSGSCVLSYNQAIAQCNSDPNCGGFNQTSGAAGSNFAAATAQYYKLFGTNFTVSVAPNSSMYLKSG